ncbi:MAG: hypothetical protein BGO51_03755 [Rhodospirillales bacterium 69-11]|nr:MAG: hypothetical protein BGO51_03755 [Rhodospirillales bacterium 69-11]
MSMDTCVDCGALVDTDNEPEAYAVTFQDGSELQTEDCRCETCRIDLAGTVTTADLFRKLCKLIEIVSSIPQIIRQETHALESISKKLASRS